MKYNNKKQPFDIVGRFRILEEEGYVEYCRVRFFNTRKEQVVRSGLIATGEFEDTSLVVEGSLKGTDEYTEAKTAKDIVDAINESPETVGEPVGEIDLSGKVEIEEVAEEPKEEEPKEEESEALVETDDFAVKYIATNPKGEDIEVYNLESFVAENGLDMEAVQSVLNGEQKTHKKWRFARA
ncbi:hypothetical protein ACW5UC_24905 [Priestia aryabhattai]|uniref:hypothetical protein n=1 Tax=Priestia megaterium TaxID=1404 RepID=UPI003F9EAD78